LCHFCLLPLGKQSPKVILYGVINLKEVELVAKLSILQELTTLDSGSFSF